MTVEIKKTVPVRVAQAEGSAAEPGMAALGPVFAALLPKVEAVITASGGKPGTSVGYYEMPGEGVVVHAGYEIGDLALKPDAEVTAVDLPVVEVASLLHRGTMASLADGYQQLMDWIDASDYAPVAPSRELYLEWHAPDSPDNVTELQMPVARKA